MAPRLVLNKKKTKLDSIQNSTNDKKLNHTLITNAKLRNKIELLSNQNKELSATRNNLLLHKLELENENNSIKNANIQLTAMHQAVCKKLSLFEQNLQKCLPALVTLSSYIPNMLESVHEMCKFDKFNEFNHKEKKEKQLNTVKPMVQGMIIDQPAVTIRRFDMPTIIESPSPSPEQTPMRPRRSSYRNSPHNKPNLEPYVRLKDVKLMLKNSKTVTSGGSYRQLDENLGEGPSWLHSQDNQTSTSNNITSVTDNFVTPPIANEIVTPTRSTSAVFNSNTSINSTFNETNVSHGNFISPNDTSMLRNITCRKRKSRRSSEASIASGIDDSNVSSRSRRSAAKNVNYKEPKLGTKLRRN